MRLLVCGGRDYANRNELYEELDWTHAQAGIDLIIQGGASGADSLAKQWATERGIPQKEYKADWDAHGKAAGPIRNRQMLDEGKPDWVYAFAGGRGTANMVSQAKTKQVPVKVFG